MMQDVAKQAEKAKTFTPGAPAAAEQKLTDEHRAIYAERIAKATTVEEVRQSVGVSWCVFGCFFGWGGFCFGFGLSGVGMRWGRVVGFWFRFV